MSGFDRETAVASWRVELAAALGDRDAADELEAHLRDEMAALEAQELRPEEAFLVARHRLGPPPALAAELGKVRPAPLFHTWLVPLHWAVMGVLGFEAARAVARALSAALLLAADAFGASLGVVMNLSVGLAILRPILVFAVLALGVRRASHESLTRLGLPFALAGLTVLAYAANQELFRRMVAAFSHQMGRLMIPWRAAEIVTGVAILAILALFARRARPAFLAAPPAAPASP